MSDENAQNAQAQAQTAAELKTGQEQVLSAPPPEVPPTSPPSTARVVHPGEIVVDRARDVYAALTREPRHPDLDRVYIELGAAIKVYDAYEAEE